MKKCVIIIDDGMIEDVLTSSKEPMEFLIVDFDKKTLDQSVLTKLHKPIFGLAEVATLVDMYKWDALYDPKNVRDAFDHVQKVSS